MIVAKAGTTGALRWAATSRAIDGEPVSGDRFVVRGTPEGVWVAVFDGLGHGPEAARAAGEAARVLEKGELGSVADALRACHAALTSTRGAVMSIARVSGERLSWVGVGNVEAALIPLPSASRERARLVLSFGVVGQPQPLPSPRPSSVGIARGDLLVLVTDGLAPDALDQVDTLASPQLVVDKLMARCRTGRDDALAFAARYDGAAP